MISPTYMGLMTSLGLNYITFKGHRGSRAAQPRVSADLGLKGLFLVNLVDSNKYQTDKQVTFGDNTETPPTVERLIDHVTFMPRLKHRFIGSSYFIFTPKLFYSYLKKTKLAIKINKC